MVPQADVHGGRLDTEDRVQFDAALVRNLVGAGL
jgi:hypothetical protein